MNEGDQITTQANAVFYGLFGCCRMVLEFWDPWVQVLSARFSGSFHSLKNDLKHLGAL